MNFRTEIKPLRLQGFINHDKPVMLIGSCFSDNIGERLAADLFNVTINPAGTLFNPASIDSLCRRLARGERYAAADLRCNDDGLWFSYSHHGRFSSTDSAATLRKINDSFDAAHAILPDVETVIITYGTTRVFTLKETGAVVANCHKMPASCFGERYLSVDEVEALATSTIEAMRSVNPRLRIVFTVSPIRHSGATLADNSLSKATLRVAISRVAAAHDNVVYFPAFEIMIDDLRDYRFYAADMKHPSPVAIDYIYDIFCQSFMDGASLEAAVDCRRLTARLAHRLDAPSTPAQQQFVDDTRALADRLKQKYPYITLMPE